jgi:hypothetical protein
MSALILIAVRTSAINTTSLWLYLVLGLITVGTLLWGGIKLIRQQGAEEVRKKDRDDKLNETVVALHTNLTNLESNVQAIEKNLKPNGLNTERLGDIAKRTENAVSSLTSKMDQHIGAEKRDREDLWHAIDDIRGRKERVKSDDNNY